MKEREATASSSHCCRGQVYIINTHTEHCTRTPDTLVDSSRPLEDVRYDLSSLVEFDGLMSLEANGFPRFALLIAQRDARKEDYARNVARRVVENLEEAIAREDDATRDRAAKLVEVRAPVHSTPGTQCRPANNSSLCTSISAILPVRCINVSTLVNCENNLVINF